MRDLYFESAGMILTLVTLGKFFEARAKRKTGEAIAALMDLRAADREGHPRRPGHSAADRAGADVEISWSFAAVSRCRWTA
ncbi:MAG: hypothetical protein ACLR4Z_05195 [Butyricicoccaceae bacterium]